MTEELIKVFTEDFLNELAKNSGQKEILTPLVHEHFKFLGSLITEDDSKVTQILGSFFLDSFAFFKYEHSFSMQQCSVLLNILLQLLLYSIKSSQFDRESDIQYFQSLLIPHAQGMNALFSPNLLKLLLQHLNLTYFNHYYLYKFLFEYPRTQENHMMLLDIDIPLPKDSHKTSTQRIHRPPSEPVIPQEQEKEAEAAQVKETLKERLLKNMNESVREKFLEKISEARDLMSKQLEQRDKALKQKWEDLEKELKRKRRRP